jgi:shikimate 5-dehydrogenase
LLPLLQQQPARVMIANRTASKAIQLAKDFEPYGKTCGFGLEKILITACVSGCLPVQNSNALAACSTNMPRPSTTIDALL